MASSSRTWGRSRAIALVETAYRSARAEPAMWLERVLEAAAPALDLGRGVFAYEFDTRKPHHAWLERPIVLGADASLGEHVLGAFHEAPRSLSELIHRRAGAVTILSELLGTRTAIEAIGEHARATMLGDMYGVNASDPSGRGVYLCAPANERITRDAAHVELWSRVAAHLAAAARLRSVLGRVEPSAILTPEGRVLHADRDARTRASELQRAARGVDRARLRDNRDDPAALNAWRALVEGRWSLIEDIERDGKRFLLAYRNPPDVVDPRRLTQIERAVAGYVAMGHSNKLIAYELGIAVGTVAGHLHRVLEKFGLPGRVALAERFARLSTATSREVIVDGETVVVVASAGAPTTRRYEELTDAESAIASLAVRGLSNREIASLRGSSVRTVANQLASVFAKLGVGSRTELAAREARRPRAS